MKYSQRWRREIGLEWRFEGTAAREGRDVRTVERYRQEKKKIRGMNRGGRRKLLVVGGT